MNNVDVVVFDKRERNYPSLVPGQLGLRHSNFKFLFIKTP